MKKIIKFNQNKNNLFTLQEALVIGDPDDMRVLKARVLDLRRLARKAREAAVEARKNQDEQLASKLEARADELEELANTAMVDTLDNDSEDDAGIDGGENKDNPGEGDPADEQPDDDLDTEEDDQGEADNDGQDEDEDQDGDDDEAKDEDQDDESEDSDNKKDSSANSEEDDAEADTQTDVESNSDETDSDKTSRNQSRQSAGQDSDEGDQAEENDGGEHDADIANQNNKRSDQDSNQEGDTGAENAANNQPQNDSSSNNSSKNNSNSQQTDDQDAGEQGSESGQDDDGSSDDSDDDEDNEGADSNRAVTDIFADDEDIPQMPQMGGGGKKIEPESPTIKDLIKQLSGLGPEAKRGAKDALTDLLAGMSDSDEEEDTTPKEESFKYHLKEAYTLFEAKPLHTYSDDAYGNLVNSTLDMIDQAYRGRAGIRTADPQARRGRVHSMDNAIDNSKLSGEIIGNAVKAKAAQAQARDNESGKYLAIKPISGLQLDLYRTIKQQVDLVIQETQSYDEINNEYEDTGLILKADVTRVIPDEAKPIIDVYFDRSGSWNAMDTAVGKKALSSLAEMEAKDEIKINLYYFDDIVTQDEHNSQLGWGGTRAWRAILENIKATRATNVVIMTDRDMSYNTYGNMSCKVPGCVWWI